MKDPQKAIQVLRDWDGSVYDEIIECIEHLLLKMEIRDKALLEIIDFQRRVEQAIKDGTSKNDPLFKGKQAATYGCYLVAKSAIEDGFRGCDFVGGTRKTNQ